MSQILIIDAGKAFACSNGELNHTLTNVAASFLRDACLPGRCHGG
ncbi:hypothetical protein [Candidatus Erwinia dacicola]|uniref:Modulator of drug activity domain protein n=1 Tax=Candidatus Erwinia dacicola TaxID=252393 RepID=A0A328TNS9_9GAMM|nr:putative modulator of drug activity domain protein [Candidatus Erwinia dacicola]